MIDGGIKIVLACNFNDKVKKLTWGSDHFGCKENHTQFFLREENFQTDTNSYSSTENSLIYEFVLRRFL